MNIELLIIALLNGLSYGLILFLLSAGLTLIFGMMRVLNLAHGSFYMLGAYVGYTATCLLDINLWLTLLLAPCLIGVLGALVEKYVIRQVQGRGHLAELLLTFGISLLILAIVQFIWGKSPVEYRIPAVLQGSAFELFGFSFPRYRIAMMFIALLVLASISVVLRIGSVRIQLKALTQNPKILESFGINVPRLMMLIFGTGCALAGLAGVLGGFAYVTEPAMAGSMGMLLFVVIIVGGIGSVRGAFITSLLLGVLQTFAVSLDVSLASLLGSTEITTVSWLHISTAQLAHLLPFALMVVVLWLFPDGLFGEHTQERW